MGRPQKSLEEQLQNTKNELAKTLEKAQNLKDKILDIEAAIEDRDMHDSYALLKEHGISVDDLAALLSKGELEAVSS